MSRLKGIRLSGMVAAVFLAVPAVHGDVIVDTGPGGTSEIGALSLFDDRPNSAAFQYLAGQFTLTEGHIIDEVQGWMSRFGNGNLGIKIYADNNGLPGQAVYSTTADVAFSGVARWVAAPAVNAALPAGKYWVSFEPPSGGFSSSMPGGAPNPLSNYAFYANDNNQWVSTAASGLGMRIHGRASHVIMGTASESVERFDTLINGQPEQRLKLGGNGNLNAVTNVGNGAARGLVTEQGLEAGALATGFADAPGGINRHSGFGSGHGVAWRPFTNNTAVPMTISLNTVLDGGGNNSFGLIVGTLNARITVLDPALLAANMQATGLDAADYFLSHRNEQTDTYVNYPAAAVITDKKFSESLSADDSGFDPMEFNIATGLFTIAPGASAVVVFDVYVDATGQSASGGGTGSFNFFNSLKPAVDFVTDANGAAVTGFVAGSSQVLPVPEPASLTLLGLGSLVLLARKRRH